MKKSIVLSSIIVIALAFVACQGGKKETAKKEVAEPQTENVTTAPVVTDSLPQVLDFYATWCGPCKQLAPILEKLEKKYENKIIFQRIDIDKHPEFVEQYDIDAVPTIIIKENKDDANYKKFVGLMNETELEKELSKIAK